MSQALRLDFGGELPSLGQIRRSFDIIPGRRSGALMIHALHRFARAWRNAGEPRRRANRE
jgi:hypothetical protein